MCERETECERERKKITKKERKKNLAKAHSLATGLVQCVEHVTMEIYQSGMYMRVALKG